MFCAVYSKDPHRHKLIFDHYENLCRQSVSFACVYIFECKDTPPPRFPAPWVLTSEPLSIYEAWNFGILYANTEFVMNLNLDDRLHTNAIELLQVHLDREKADLVGGDWEIKYTQEDTDRVSTCKPLTDVPFLPTWPPGSGTFTRLGSGSGERGTLGPATLWRRSLHKDVPRYPQRLQDGTVIRSIGDALWWMVIRDHLKKRLTRLPLIIGNYHSHPSEQAEFRYEAEWAFVKKSGLLSI